MAWVRTQGLLNTAGLPCPILSTSCLTPNLSSSPSPLFLSGQREGQETPLESTPPHPPAVRSPTGFFSACMLAL